jgi:hypothetical protein
MNKIARPLCKSCKARPRAYAYKKESKIYWRSLCDRCNRIKAKKNVGGVTRLERSGYRKRKMCELCGFKAQDKIQLDVKTVCANCQRLGGVRKLGWRVGDLVADD